MATILEIDNEKIDEAMKIIKNSRINCKLYENGLVKFKLIRDSFQAFIDLGHKKISVKFHHR